MQTSGYLQAHGILHRRPLCSHPEIVVPPSKIRPSMYREVNVERMAAVLMVLIHRANCGRYFAGSLENGLKIPAFLRGVGQIEPPRKQAHPLSRQLI